MACKTPTLILYKVRVRSAKLCMVALVLRYTALCRAFKSVAIRGRMIELASYFGTINLAMEDGCALAISCLGMCPITLSLMISPHFSSKMTHNPPLGWQIPVLRAWLSLFFFFFFPLQITYLGPLCLASRVTI